MFTALFIIILSNADFDFNYLYRKPDSPKIDPGCYQISGDQILVWVYFTDKGVFTASDYQRALSGNQQYIAPASKMRRKKRGGVYDFGDLPLCTDYIDEIHAAGGVLRWESKWLNGASFLLPKNVLERIANFDFVYKIKPVAHYEIFNELESPAVRQVSDTTAFSYHQHRMFNIDRLHKRGIFGSKVKVGFLDSGFSDKHEVFRYIKLAGQYDFISGDRVCFDTLPFSIRTNPPMSKGLIGEIFVHDGRTEDFVIYSKDSAVAGSGFRGLYGLRSLDGGRTWTEGQLSDLYSNAGYPWLCGQDTVYLFYHRYKTPSEIWGMARYNSLWDTIGNFYNGLYPSAGVIGDTFFLSYVSAYDIFSDTVLLMRKGTVGGFLSENIIYHSNQKIRKPWVITRSSLPTDSLVGILFYTYPTKNIIFLRSIDRGQNFTSQTVLSTATDFALATSFDTIYLICKKYSDLPSPYIVFLKSTDFGLTWQGEQNLTSNPLPAVGKLGVAVKDNQVFVEWERWGKVYYRRSNNSGSSFGNLDSLRGDFFYLPTPEYLTFQNDTNLFNFWVWRGDNNTDYEPNDPNRSQPDHGTHMVSIVGGFKTGTYVGVAPSAEFYMAKTENSDPAYEFPIEEDTYIAGLEWLEGKGVDVVNSSLGYSRWYWPDSMDGKTAPTSIACEFASKRGMLIVTAAGNRSDTITPRPYLVAPGDADGVITVGGIDTSFGRWRGSGYGPTRDRRMKPELVCLAKNYTVASYDTASQYFYSSGTSGATALVSGICALLLEGHPNWSADSVKNALFKTASLAGSPNDTMGYGWPDAEKAFFISPPLIDTQITYLLPPFPNPLICRDNDTLAYIPFKIYELSSVELKIFSMSGRLVYDSTRVSLLPGLYNSKDPNSPFAAFIWNLRDRKGGKVGSGLYCILFLGHPGKDIEKLAIIR